MSGATGLRPGGNLSSFFRTSHTIYRARPPASRKSARWAWDYFAARGPVRQVRLLDGYWGVLRNDSDGPDEIEAPMVLHAVRTGRLPVLP